MDREPSGSHPGLVDLLDAALAPQTHHHVDPRHLEPLGRLRRIEPGHRGPRDVVKLAVVLDQKMMMLGRVGVEIDPRAVDRDLAQNPDGGELVQRVVNRRQRDGQSRRRRLLEQPLRRHVTVAPAKQQLSQRHALARRPQTGRDQPGRKGVGESLRLDDRTAGVVAGWAGEQLSVHAGHSMSPAAS